MGCAADLVGEVLHDAQHLLTAARGVDVHALLHERVLRLGGDQTDDTAGQLVALADHSLPPARRHLGFELLNHVLDRRGRLRPEDDAELGQHLRGCVLIDVVEVRGQPVEAHHPRLDVEFGSVRVQHVGDGVGQVLGELGVFHATLAALCHVGGVAAGQLCALAELHSLVVGRALFQRRVRGFLPAHAVVAVAPLAEGLLSGLGVLLGRLVFGPAQHSLCEPRHTLADSHSATPDGRACDTSNLAKVFPEGGSALVDAPDRMFGDQELRGLFQVLGIHAIVRFSQAFEQAGSLGVVLHALQLGGDEFRPLGGILCIPCLELCVGLVRQHVIGRSVS